MMLRPAGQILSYVRIEHKVGPLLSSVYYILALSTPTWRSLSSSKITEVRSQDEDGRWLLDLLRGIQTYSAAYNNGMVFMGIFSIFFLSSRFGLFEFSFTMIRWVSGNNFDETGCLTQVEIVMSGVHLYWTIPNRFCSFLRTIR